MVAGGNLDDGSVFMVQFMSNETRFEAVQRDPARMFSMLFFGTDGEAANKDPFATRRMGGNGSPQKCFKNQ